MPCQHQKYSTGHTAARAWNTCQDLHGTELVKYGEGDSPVGENSDDDPDGVFYVIDYSA